MYPNNTEPNEANRPTSTYELYEHSIHLAKLMLAAHLVNLGMHRESL